MSLQCEWINLRAQQEQADSRLDKSAGLGSALDVDGDRNLISARTRAVIPSPSTSHSESKQVSFRVRERLIPSPSPSVCQVEQILCIVPIMAVQLWNLGLECEFS